jgi:hypothetical protein
MERLSIGDSLDSCILSFARKALVFVNLAQSRACGQIRHDRYGRPPRPQETRDRDADCVPLTMTARRHDAAGGGGSKAEMIGLSIQQQDKC